jgi:hypothetical protein
MYRNPKLLKAVASLPCQQCGKKAHKRPTPTGVVVRQGHGDEGPRYVRCGPVS